MAHYFLHLRDSTGQDLNSEADVEMPKYDVADVALTAARECITADLADGCLDVSYRIDVHNESGELVHSLPFAKAIEVIAAE